jgi:hypothetical protein
VKPVVVEIAGSGALELLGEETLVVALLFKVHRGQFIGNGETAAWITVDERRLQRALAVAAVVHIGGVEIGKSAGHKKVHHFFELFDIHAFLILRVEQRKTHESESEFFHKIIPPVRIDVFSFAAIRGALSPSISRRARE